MDDKNKNSTQHPGSEKPLVTSREKTIQPSEALVKELDAKRAAAATNSNNVDNVAPPAQPIASSSPVAATIPPATTANPQPPPDTSEPLVGLTGSQIKPEKQPLINLKGMPIGIYVIIVLLVTGFILGFFNNDTRTLESLSLIVNLGLAIGLIFRKEAVRKTIVVFSGLLVILYVLIVVGLVVARLEASSKIQQVQTDLAQISSLNRLTPTQTEEVNAFRAAISKQEKILNKRYSVAYTEYAVVISANLILIIYLSLPKVKSAFS